MFSTLRNKRTLAATTSGGVIAVATLLGTGICAADNNWTITVKNGSKVPADVTILCESKPAGSKATGVRPDGGTATITIPAAVPACKGKYSWKAEYAGKVCGSHSVDISGSTTVSVTCDAAPPASAASSPAPAPAAAPPNLRLKSPAELEKEIDDTDKDLAKAYDELDKVDSQAKIDALKKRAEKDRETVYRVKTILEGRQKSVIETNPPDWTVLKQKTTDVGAKAEAFQKKVLGCVLAGDLTQPDPPKPDSTPPNLNVAPATNIDPPTKGKHAVGCKKTF
jgi:hypothetical protein